MFRFFRFLLAAHQASDGMCWGCRNKLRGVAASAAFEDVRSCVENNTYGALKIKYRFFCEDSPTCRVATHQTLYCPERYVNDLQSCRTCWTLETENLQFQHCPKCKVTFYCSEACQKQDWKAHKKACKELVLCDGCNKTEEKSGSFMKCGRCHCAVYCSQDCQRAHWKHHKKSCRAAKKKKASTTK